MKWKKTFITLHLRLTEYFENEDDITFDEVTQLLVKNKATSPPNDFLSILNSINPSLQFTMKYSKGAIPFLDILIQRSNDKIGMDTHECLPFSSSNHPN